MCDYWKRLPTSLKSLDDDISYENLVQTLLGPAKSSKIVLPLSLLALRRLECDVCVSRTFVDPKFSSNKNSYEEKLESELQKRVKPKKLHEIQKMIQICDETTRKTHVQTIIDFGSGLGHLSRHLQYKLGLDMTCIEQNASFLAEAKRIDVNLERKFMKISRNVEIHDPGQIFHIEKRLENEKDFNDILILIKNNLNSCKNGEKFGLIGLHPCGDLAVLLLMCFLHSPEVKFLQIVGCCYMKLTTETTVLMEGRICKSRFSYPLSTFLRRQGRNVYELSYEALESATHAKEKYLDDVVQRRKNNEFYKINSFRAAIESIIVKYWPEKRHLRNVRYEESLTFDAYCVKAVSGLGINIPMEDVESKETQERLKNWKRVAIFYLLRLSLSPFIESALLYDRQLFLMENGCECDIKTVFDPRISPRCHVMSAIKK